ncbi:MAG: RNA ligase [Chloroflexota bacterium]
MLESIQDLQRLVISGEINWEQYGDVRASYQDEFVLFNYLAKAQYANRWNWFELNSRGLILHVKTGEIVARPFPKFFNWSEYGRTTDAPIKFITEKIDGSLGILYRANGDYRIATRGAFAGEQALWATDYLRDHFALPGLANELTLLFEIVYPDNRIVVNYGDREDLILLGARNRFTGDMLPLESVRELAAQYGFNMPTSYDFSSVDDMIEAAGVLTAEHEGWVATFEDGSIFKFKGTLYQMANRLLIGVTFNHVLDAIANGQFDSLIEGVPDEFLTVVREHQQKIEATVAEVTSFVEQEMRSAPTESRRDFALWVQGRYKGVMHTSYFFAALDGKPLAPLIYKHAFE